nr:hypothetical protein [Qipengyuania mesophila]
MRCGIARRARAASGSAFQRGKPRFADIAAPDRAEHLCPLDHGEHRARADPRIGIGRRQGMAVPLWLLFVAATSSTGRLAMVARLFWLEKRPASEA